MTASLTQEHLLYVQHTHGGRFDFISTMEGIFKITASYTHKKEKKNDGGRVQPDFQTCV